MPGGVAAEQYIDGSSRPVSQFSRVGVHFRNNDGTPLPDGHASTARAFCPQSHFFMYTQVAPPQRITGIGQTPPIQGNGEREKGGKHFAHSKASFKSEQTLKPTGMGLGSSHTNLATIGSESGLNDRAESVKFKPIKSPGKRHSSSNSATAMTRGTSSTSDTQGLSTSHTGTSSATARRVQSTLLPVSTSGSTTINSSNSNMNASANQTASNTPVANPSANESDTNANAEDPYPHTVYCVAVPVTVANNMMSIYSVCFSFFIRGDLLSRYAEGAGGTDQTGIVLGVSDQSMHWEDIPAGNIRGKVVGLKEPFIMFSLQSFSEESTTPTLDGVVLGLANEETILQVLRDILPVSDNAFGEECMLLHTSNSSQPIADNRLFLSKVGVRN
ncbi:hypothetical protein SARC_12575 [Sphaeroforma arctica JP610]|uniref:Uncharacterized protein n=1 Tax=Sphaeroforma arctica JP610 TaxID=667725 RepID=A0A0L0FFP9_9EUKA|nr:hypothetical protein SARC_12575 [Sphaeroforma arctica JP610]KNC74888.1 hypothetical protein SARC_12575 [Sphaeroforma arctica JP610]|eukprot:XP_014148790.1 hypothetical protein SARC_12575 [Sphaeroforma arctica JP610]